MDTSGEMPSEMLAPLSHDIRATVAKPSFLSVSTVYAFRGSAHQTAWSTASMALVVVRTVG